MKTYAYTIELKDDPDVIKKYKEYHKAVWPEVLESGKKLGIVWQKIFLLGTRLFMIIQAGEDFKPEDMANYTIGPKEKEWDELMRSFQIPVKEAAAAGEWWAQMELVYDLDWFE